MDLLAVLGYHREEEDNENCRPYLEIQFVHEGMRSRHGRPKAKVALARRLLIRLYVMLRDQIDYDEFCRRARTGSRRSCR